MRDDANVDALILEDRSLEAHAGERPDALPRRPVAASGDAYRCRVGRFEIVVRHAALAVDALDGPPFSAAIAVQCHHYHWPALRDPDVSAAYAVLPDGSLWCFTADGTGVPVEAGTRTRVNALVELVDALHVRGTDEMGLRARLAPVDVSAAADAVLDWAIGSATVGLRAGGFDDEATQLDDIGRLAGWDLLPEEASAIGEVLAAPWEDDLDRRAGEEAAVIWTLVASALAGAHAVTSRAVLLVERSRVLASHPCELPLHEVGGAFPYLTAGTDGMDEGSRREIERIALGLLAAACTARCADLAPDADDLLNDVRQAGFAVVEALAQADRSVR